jgi:mycofactocin precursor
MDQETLASDATDEHATVPTTSGAAPGDLVADELLIEEISIDGMCGVY